MIIDLTRSRRIAVGEGEIDHAAAALSRRGKRDAPMRTATLLSSMEDIKTAD
jgi:hypothetical protein